jgi:hypothetical protein
MVTTDSLPYDSDAFWASFWRDEFDYVWYNRFTPEERGDILKRQKEKENG